MLPIEFKQRITEQLGEKADDFMRTSDEPYVKSLRINHMKNPDMILPYGSLDACMMLSKSKIAWEESGIYYYEDDDSDKIKQNAVCLKSPGKSPLHAAGAYYIQEASAMLPVSMLDVNDSGMKVLDLCAAPGGKTTQIADKMKGRGILVCNEIVKDRARILSENIERMGVINALVVSSDPNPLSDRFYHFFDRILVDAPCSGEGMFRKHPEAVAEWSTENVNMCAKRQDNILDCAAKMLAVGGRIVYSTCTFSPEEDEGSVERFLCRHPEFSLVKMEKLYPNEVRGEGHFSACFVYKGYESVNQSGRETNNDNVNAGDSITNKKKKKNVQGRIAPSRQQLEIVSNFFTSILNNDPEVKKSVSADMLLKALDTGDRLYMFGDRVYMAPYDMPSIQGMSVLRAGLELGTVIKDRFEPAHALALALSPNDVRNYIDFESDSEKVGAYLRGQTVNHEGEKGWYLVCTQGISLGWGKLTGNILKNHYPKGLRVMG